MKRREFLGTLAATTTALSLTQMESLLAAVGYHEDGAYNGPLVTRYLNSTCGACPGGCGIRVRTVDGIPVKIDGNPINPVNRGGLCPVGVSSLAFLVHPDRVKYPMLRTGPRGSGEYRQLSWEETEKLIIEKLKALQKDGKQHELLFVDSRDRGPGMEMARKFVYDFGSPNFFHGSQRMSAVYNSVWGGESTEITYDLENARTIFCFGLPAFESGRNPVYFAGLRNRLLNRSEGDHGRFVIIDPRLSASAAKAERWVPIKPNTYGLLALGMIYLLVKERLYDKNAVLKYCEGFEDSTDRHGRVIEGFRTTVLKNYYPSFVSEYTGIPVDQIITLARLFATGSNTIALAGDAVLQAVDGSYQSWAIMALNVLSGKFGSQGGINAARKFPFSAIGTKKPNSKPLITGSGNSFPLQDGIGSIETLPDHILSATPYPTSLAVFNNVNPVYDSPQSNRFRQALQNIPFSIVVTNLFNESAALADLILPECTYLEKYDLVVPDSDFSFPVLSMMKPVIKPLYDSRQSDDVVLSLGRKLFGKAWQQWENYSSYLESRLEEIYKSNVGTLFSDQFEVSFKSLLAERGWRRQEHKDFSDFLEHLVEAGGWWQPTQTFDTTTSSLPTQAGKFYLSTRMLRQITRMNDREFDRMIDEAGISASGSTGYNLGAYREFATDEDTQFPLDLCLFELTISRGEGGRLKDMADLGGFYQNVKWCSWVELNPKTAEDLGLNDGQDVWVESSRGKQKLKLIINPGLFPGVAAIPVGLSKDGSYSFGKNPYLIASTERDFLTGMPATAETKLKIYV